MFKNFSNYSGVVLLRLLVSLPYKTLVSIGYGLGYLAGYIPNGRNRVVEKNLELCFPELSETEIDQLKFQLRDLSYRVEQIKRIRIILNEVNPKIFNYPGEFLVLNEIINKIINIKSDIDDDDIYSKLTLNIFLGKLNLIKSQFLFALVPAEPVQMGKPGLLKMIGKGFVSGVLLCFVILMSRIAWKNIKNNN